MTVRMFLTINAKFRGILWAKKKCKSKLYKSKNIMKVAITKQIHVKVAKNSSVQSAGMT